MIGDRVVVHIHVVKFGIRSVSQFVSATLGLLTGPRVTDTDDSRESPLRSAPFLQNSKTLLRTLHAIKTI